jgi:hypothetical protein
VAIPDEERPISAIAGKNQEAPAFKLNRLWLATRDKAQWPGIARLT